MPTGPAAPASPLQFVLNYEEGGENSILHGDKASEAFLSEIVGAQPLEGVRHISMEQIYEYGSRVGVWRLLRLFDRERIPLTIFAVATAAERHPAAIRAMVDAGHEIASHGLKWINYQYVPEEIERQHLRDAIGDPDPRSPASARWAGTPAAPAPTPAASSPSMAASSTTPTTTMTSCPTGPWSTGRPQLIVPYTLDANDMRFATPQGFNSGDQFYAYLKDSFDVLYAEGAETPRMMSVGLHCRLVGRPGRFAALERFLDYAQQHEAVWFCRRVDIARHWRERHPFQQPQP